MNGRAFSGLGHGLQHERSLFYLLLARGIAVLCAFGIHIILGNILGVDQYGIYSAALSILTVLLVAGKLGVDNGLMKIASIRAAKDDWHGALEARRSALRLSLPAVIGLGLLVALALYYNLLFDSTNIRNTVYFALIAAPFIVTIHINQTILRAFGKSFIAELLDGLAQPLILLTAILSAFFILAPDFLRGSASDAMLLNALSIAVVSLVAFWLVRVHAPEMPRRSSAAVPPKGLASTSLALYGGAVATVAMMQMDVVVVTHVAGPEAGGLYGVAYRIAALAAVVTTAVSIIGSPAVGRALVENDKPALHKALRFMSLAAPALAGAIAVFCWMFGEDIIRIFGGDYTDALSLLNLNLASQVAYSMGLSSLVFLSISGRHKIVALSHGVVAVFTVLAYVVLTKHFGPMGALGAKLAGFGTLSAVLIISSVLCLRAGK